MDRLEVSIDKLEYVATFYLSGQRVACLRTNNLATLLQECENKSLMMLGLAKGKVMTTSVSKH